VPPQLPQGVPGHGILRRLGVPEGEALCYWRETPRYHMQESSAHPLPLPSPGLGLGAARERS